MQLILHHHDPSPFAEKIRLLFGLKGLEWHSVEIPMIMPKPDLTALTGGYRKTPVLQIGADVYCDTRAIAERIDALFPEPALFASHTHTLAIALAYWADSVLFPSGAALSMGTNAGIPQAVLDDRLAFFDFLQADDLASPQDHYYAPFTAGLRELDRLLADGRPWLLGDAPGWADLSCYASVWMCRGNIAGAAQLLAPFTHLQRWEQRVAAIGHGTRHGIDAHDALAIAAAAPPLPPDTAARTNPWPRLETGTSVAVSAVDYGREPSLGILEALSDDAIVIARDDPRAGRVHVHFPRLGYRVEAAD